MASKRLDDSVSGTRPTATPDTISDLAAQANIGPIDEKTALIIKLCEANASNKNIEKISKQNEKIIELEEKYKSLLHELRDRLQTVNFDDFIKILIGILGGFVVRAFSQQGTEAIKDTWVGISIFFSVIGLFFLAIRYLGPSKRKLEIKNELESLVIRGKNA